jgi:hypothetical protein
VQSDEDLPRARSSGGIAMKEITVNKDLVAYCGLYCGACPSYLKDRCPGCHENVKAKWCKIRACCAEHSYGTCADCKELTDPNYCGQFNNLIARTLGFLFNSNRPACVLKIRELGTDGFAKHMAENKRLSMPRRRA